MRFNTSLQLTLIVSALMPALTACNNGNTRSTTAKTDTIKSAAAPVTDIPDSLSGTALDTNMYATEYVVIADTGHDYYKLRTLMFAINKSLHWSVDTMNRYYNTKKQEIVLSENDDDEIYR